MAVDFENMGYETVTKTISRIKWPPNQNVGSPTLYDLSQRKKLSPILKIWAMKPYRRQFCRIKMADEFEELIAEGLLPITELKMAADFENMGYETVMKVVSRIKMAAEFD